MNLFSRVFTRKGVVLVILLNGDERITVKSFPVKLPNSWVHLINPSKKGIITSCTKTKKIYPKEWVKIYKSE
jgi:hypothetical protein